MTKSIYIAGPMAGMEDFRNAFNQAEGILRMRGWTVLNPACLPDGLPHDAYMPICLAMLGAADAIMMLSGSDESRGAEIERRFADYQGKEIYFGLRNVPFLEDDEC